MQDYQSKPDSHHAFGNQESACLFAIFLQGWISSDPTKTRKSAGHSDKQQL